MRINRRELAIGASAVVLTAACSPPAAAEDEDLANFIAEALNEGVPVSTTGTTTDLAELRANPALLKSVGGVKKEVAAGQLKSTELEDVDAIDYAHIVRSSELGADGEFKADTFILNDALLRSIVSAGSYDAGIAGAERVVFGLRGCQLATGDTATGLSIEILESKIDHVDPHCLVGVWKPATQEITAFAGSTVPNIVNMQMFLFYRFAQRDEAPKGVQVDKIMCGLLPQGLHTYKVGTHYAAVHQPGALRQNSASPVVRAQTKLHYSFSELWDPLDWQPVGFDANSVRVTNVNIHSAANKHSPPFASAGCQTLSGRYDAAALESIGCWSGFQEAMDIKIGPKGVGSNQEGTSYRYLLTTGREARLHALYASDPAKLALLRRLKIGSSGAPVAALRKKLLGEQDTGDKLDAAFMNTLLRNQGAWGVPRDGMWTPQLDADKQAGAWPAP